jgi:hypothetical protein
MDQSAHLSRQISWRVSLALTHRAHARIYAYHQFVPHSINPCLIVGTRQLYFNQLFGVLLILEFFLYSVKVRVA